MNGRKALIGSAVYLLIVSFLLNSAWGHAAIVWAYVENNHVYVEAFYPSGAKIKNTKVVVLDKDGKTLLEGKTDDEGKYSYKPLSKDPQTIVVIAGESHIGDFELTVDDLAGVELE